MPPAAGSREQRYWTGVPRAYYIATALKVEGGIALVPAEPVAMPPVGAPARQMIDWTRRHRHMRVHTALHLLFGGDSPAGDGRPDRRRQGAAGLRHARTPGDVAALDEALNSLIARDLTVSDDWISDEELLANPGLVKTMSVRPPMGQGRVRLVRIMDDATLVDLQPCGLRGAYPPHGRDRPGRDRQDREQGPPEPPE